ncbi:BON domain-containing protein [Cupriavidus sp. 2TAF22]|uniref:BON domain-containing protein n=1 Tax=unclassified Cupriavidus TaxID=2640874 RepID=UPI003F8FDA6D
MPEPLLPAAANAVSVVFACAVLAAAPAGAADASAAAGRYQNRDNDPFFQVSAKIANCPEPLGPRVDEAEWLRDSHHRIEHGNHCWLEGRCRLPSAYQYDREIAEGARRRLQAISTAMPGWRDSTLWFTVRQRWLLVQGCVGRGFAREDFFKALREVADVERVIDQTTADPARGVPYPVFGGP